VEVAGIGDDGGELAELFELVHDGRDGTGTGAGGPQANPD
jgi:hypothetical protein